MTTITYPQTQTLGLDDFAQMILAKLRANSAVTIIPNDFGDEIDWAHSQECYIGFRFGPFFGYVSIVGEPDYSQPIPQRNEEDEGTRYRGLYYVACRVADHELPELIA